LLNNRRRSRTTKETQTCVLTIQTHLTTVLNQYCHTKPLLLVGFSGGVDSVVLLHALIQLQRNHEHTIQAFSLHVIHVHHGLSTHADEWAQFCKQFCGKYQIPFALRQVYVNKESPLGIEAAAREARYEALFNYQFLGKAADFILTGHHQNDQAETLMLQLLRGAGLKGMAGMAEIDYSKRLLRPFLAIAKPMIIDYANTEKLNWCEDDSNSNTDFDRNFLRQTVIPQIETRYPAMQSVLARTATHIAESQDLLNDLGQLDANQLIEDNSICCIGLSKLSPARARNLLRWWFADNHLKMPSTDLLNEIMSQLLGAKIDARIKIKIQHLFLQRFQNRAYLNAEKPSHAFDLLWSGEPELKLPDGSKLIFTQVKGEGLAIKHGMARLRITNRKGGERFKPEANRPSRTLKYLLQSVSISPWRRENMPLIYWNDALAYVPVVGAVFDLKASGDEEGISISWEYS